VRRNESKRIYRLAAGTAQAWPFRFRFSFLREPTPATCTHLHHVYIYTQHRSNMASQAETAPPVFTSQTPGPRPLSRYQLNLRKYGLPLPINLLDAPADGKPGPAPSYLNAITPSFLLHRRIEIPHCTGVYDSLTRSVWVTKREDIEILFCRGFFGKGTLSRSEATWRDRRVDLVKGGNCEAINTACITRD
jgi:hypothetical protein